MAVSYSFIQHTESHTGTSGSTNEASFSWTHNADGAERASICFVTTLADADDITSVTYDGIEMTQIAEAIDTEGEPARTTAFFLGNNTVTANPTVTVNRVNNSDEMYAWVVSFDADTDCEAVGAVLIEENGSYSVASVDDGSPGTDSLRCASAYWGGNSPPGIATGSFGTLSIDFGANAVQGCHEITAGQGSRNVGFDQAGNDDRAAVHLAVREIRPNEEAQSRVVMSMP